MVSGFEQLAQKKNVDEFNRRALEIAEVTGRVGAVWEQIAAMGFVLDRSNTLYSSVPGALAGAPSAADGLGIRRMTAERTPILEFPSDLLAPEGESGRGLQAILKADSTDVETDFLGPEFSLDPAHGKSMAIAPTETPVSDPSKGRALAAPAAVAEPRLQLETS